MAARSFKFVSPGIFLKEIDNSQIPSLPGPIGPVIIGRTRRGPAMRPVVVSSLSELEQKFGTPIAGTEGAIDAWREGPGLGAPTYATYAAKAYLSTLNESVVTMIRLLGVDGSHESKGPAGWESKAPYGLFVINSGSATDKEARLVAIVHGEDDFELGLKGTHSGSANHSAHSTVHSDLKGDVVELAGNRKAQVIVHSGTKRVDTWVALDHSGDESARQLLNTNPVTTNSSVSWESGVDSSYWLGETFNHSFAEFAENTASFNAASGEKLAMVALPLSTDAGRDMGNYRYGMTNAATGWVFHQNFLTSSMYDPDDFQKLFRVHARDSGVYASANYIVRIENIRIPEPDSLDPFGKFDIKVFDTSLDKNLNIPIDSYANCDLNPASDDFVARKIGDQHMVYDAFEKRNKLYGNYANNSPYIRIELSQDVENRQLKNVSAVPFGYYGPVVPEDVSTTLSAGSKDLSTLNKWVGDGTITLNPGSSNNSELTSNIIFKWPNLPIIKSANTNDPVFGISPHRLTVDGTVVDKLDGGYIDYVRRLPSDFITTNYKSGLIDSGTTKYSYIFSLDEVVLEANAGTINNDLSDVTFESIRYIPGSHIGNDAATATPTTVPSGAINIAGFDQATADYIQLTDGNNTVRFVMDTTVGAQSSTNGADQFFFNGAVAVKVGLSGVGNAGDVVTRLINAINDQDGADGALTLDLKAVIGTSAAANGHDANLAATAIYLSSSVYGTTGNSNIDVSNMTSTDLLFGMKGGSGATLSAAKTNAYTSQFSASVMLDKGVNAFQMPLVGGSDGLNIVEADPFNNRGDVLGDKDTYAHATVLQAIELIRDPEAIEHNLAVMPGITTEALTTKLVRTCESRADSLAVIDLPDVYRPPAEQRCETFQDRFQTTAKKTASALKKRQLNSSYGCAYYPWVKILDDQNENAEVWIPPSIIALGVFGFTEQRDDVWFAPAGFNRGGLNQGNSGLPVVQCSEQLMSSQRDALYDANINPIASFVAEGIVVFGQKTLQSTKSALDRINVRRLLIFIKKEVSRYSSQLLFDQNLPATWNRFKGLVIPFLQSVQTRLGLADFKVVLDNTTTTADLVDRNIMYAKIFLKPARSIEFIAVDFVITRSGASFDD